MLWWRTVASGASPPAVHRVAGLKDTTTVTWTKENTASIQATSSRDALTALGYVHGLSRGWTVTVWRRTALGTLSSWLGRKLVPIDRHARRLGFARHAQRAYDQLPSSAQSQLRSYTQGLNEALESDYVQNHEAFLTINEQPKRWKPWHPLAIERLLAWISTGDSIHSSDRSEGPTAFQRNERLLRRWLHLYGWNRSLVWAARSARDSTQTAVFTRHVLGASADPLIQEIVLHRPKRPATTFASLPGTLLFPTGTRGTRTWAYLLSSSKEIDLIKVDSAQTREYHERIRPASGDERLVRIQKHRNGLLLSPVPPDSAWILRWDGLRPGSDVPRWIREADLQTAPARTDAENPDFRLIEGIGITSTSRADWTVQGQPRVVERSEGSILIGRSKWARYQAESLQSHRRSGPLKPGHWSISDSSTWAAALLPRLLPSLKGLSRPDSILRGAYSYLQNWNYTYAPASIGAVLFEQWMRTYRKREGHLPLQTEHPSYFATMRRRQAFVRAVDVLISKYGADVRQWRWENVARTNRYFLGWSADSLISADLTPLSSTQFAPVRRPGRGHVSALSGGPTFAAPLPLGSAPTHWDGWTLSGNDALRVRRLRFDPSGAFARAMLPDERPEPISVSTAKGRARTVLVPDQ